jgi:hypothetical protein
VIIAILTWWQQHRAKPSPSTIELPLEQSENLQALREVVQELEHQQQLANRQTAARLRSDPNYCNSIPRENQELFFQIVELVD